MSFILPGRSVVDLSLLRETLEYTIKRCSAVVETILELLEKLQYQPNHDYFGTIQVAKILLQQMQMVVKDAPISSTLMSKFPSILPLLQTLLPSLQRFENALTKYCTYSTKESSSSSSPTPTTSSSSSSSSYIIPSSSTNVADHAPNTRKNIVSSYLSAQMVTLVPVARQRHILDRCHLTINSDLQALMNSATRSAFERHIEAFMSASIDSTLAPKDVSSSIAKDISSSLAKDISPSSSSSSSSLLSSSDSNSNEMLTVPSIAISGVTSPITSPPISPRSGPSSPITSPPISPRSISPNPPSRPTASPATKADQEEAVPRRVFERSIRQRNLMSVADEASMFGSSGSLNTMSFPGNASPGTSKRDSDESPIWRNAMRANRINARGKLTGSDDLSADDKDPQIRDESGAGKEDTSPLQATKKEASFRSSLHFHLRGILTSTSGRTFWNKHFGLDTLSVSWETFSQSMLASLPGSAVEEDLKQLRLLLDPFEEGEISIFKFSEFLSSFGPLQECLKNMKALFSQPYFHGFLPSTVSHFILKNCEPGFFLARFSEFTISDISIDVVSPNKAIHHYFVEGNPQEGFTLVDRQPNKEKKSAAFLKKVKPKPDAPLTITALIERESSQRLRIPLKSKLPLLSNWCFGSPCVIEIEKTLRSSHTGTYAVCLAENPGELYLVYTSAKGTTQRLSLAISGAGFSFIPGAEKEAEPTPSPPVFDTIQALIDSKNSLLKYPYNPKRRISKNPSCAHLLRSFSFKNLDMGISRVGTVSDHSERTTSIVNWIVEGEGKTRKVIARLADMFYSRSGKAALEQTEEDEIKKTVQETADKIWAQAALLLAEKKNPVSASSLPIG